MYLNKVQIIGNLTKDPELKSLPSGTTVVSFSVATNEVTKDKAGNKIEKVEFHNIISFGKTAENIARFMKKGSQIFIEGKIQTRSWDGQDGKKNYRTEILAQTVQFGNKPQGTSNRAGSAGSADHGSVGGSNGAQDDLEQAHSDFSSVDYPDAEINPEDIPF